MLSIKLSCLILIIIFFSCDIQIGPKRSKLPGSEGFVTIGASGSEKWIIEGNEYSIDCTYYIVFSEGQLQYTIAYPFSFNNENIDLTEEQAMPIIFPIIKYAYKNKLYDRINDVKILDTTSGINVKYIAVVLFERMPGNKIRGKRFNMSFNEIENFINRKKLSL